MSHLSPLWFVCFSTSKKELLCRLVTDHFHAAILLKSKRLNPVLNACSESVVLLTACRRSFYSLNTMKASPQGSCSRRKLDRLESKFTQVLPVLSSRSVYRRLNHIKMCKISLHFYIQVRMTQLFFLSLSNYTC